MLISYFVLIYEGKTYKDHDMNISLKKKTNGMKLWKSQVKIKKDLKEVIINKKVKKRLDILEKHMILTFLYQFMFKKYNEIFIVFHKK